MPDQKADSLSSSDVLEPTVQIVSAYAGHGKLTPTELTEMIGTVARALSQIGGAPAAAPTKSQEPATSIKKSVSADFLICLEDGKKLKMLKRHLMSTYGMTPAEYRVKWGLPRDYPMVAPNYAAIRSQLAKKIGLGKSPAAIAQLTEPVPVARRGRPKKATA